MMMIIVVFSAAQTIREHSCTDCCKTKRKKRYGDIKEDDLQRGNNEVHSICVPYGPLFPDENVETVIPLFFFLIPFLHFAFLFSFSVKTIKIVVDDARIRLFSNTHIRSTRATKSDGALVPLPPPKKKTKKIKR